MGEGLLLQGAIVRGLEFSAITVRRKLDSFVPSCKHWRARASTPLREALREVRAKRGSCSRGYPCGAEISRREAL
jgi:hypothetical protein